MATDITITGIMNITRTSALHLLPSGWLALLALLLVVFGVPSLVMRFSTLSQEDTRLELLQGKAVAQQELSAFIQGREKALSLLAYSGFYNDLAMAALEASSRVSAGSAQQAFIEQAAFWQKRALGLAPADPYGWFRLAYIYETQDGPSVRATRAWLQSFSAAPYEPRLVLPRLLMALRFGDRLGLDSHTLVRRLILQAWDYNPWDLTRAARDNNFLPLAQEVLRDNPEDLARLDLILREQL